MIKKKLKQQITQKHGKGLSKLLLQVMFFKSFEFSNIVFY
jgi:hypothetical protein